MEKTENAAQRVRNSTIYDNCPLSGTVKEEIEKETDVNACTDGGVTLLHLCTRLTNKEEVRETIDLLLARGADVNAPDARGKTPMDWAKEAGTAHILYRAIKQQQEKEVENLFQRAKQELSLKELGTLGYMAQVMGMAPVARQSFAAKILKENRDYVRSVKS